ncbi:MAG TPA: hypothetical protein VLB80_02905 [Candidatus Babeliales bacterium]|nr:hypothetical protein [Candidatus Babeliales bacterium]
MKQTILLSLLLINAASANFFYCSRGDFANSYVGTQSGNTTVVTGPNGYFGVGIQDSYGNFCYND